MRRRGSNSEENHSNGDNDHGDGEMNRMPMDQVVISEVELSAIDRIIARQSTGRNPAQTQRPSPYPRQLFSTISYPVGSDLRKFKFKIDYYMQAFDEQIDRLFFN